MEELRQIVRLLKEEDLTEITVWNGDNRITVRRDGVLFHRNAKGAEEKIIADEGDGSDDNVITAPLLGTFYSRPNPEEDPFVEEGDLISPGDTLCIIDAMKVMNEIKAEVSARIAKVLVNDGDPVEYGQPLFLLEAI